MTTVLPGMTPIFANTSPFLGVSKQTFSPANLSKFFLIKKSPLAQKIIDFIQPFFPLVPAICFCFQGAKEMIWDARRRLVRDVSKNPLVSAPTRKYFLKHGGLLLGAGIFTGIAAKELVSNTLFSVCAKAGHLFFLGANLIGLEENVRLYEHAKRIDVSDSHNQKRAFWLRHSAVFGILCNLGYIAAGALTLFGASTTMALIVGVIAAFSGGLKALCDFMDWLKQHPKADVLAKNPLQ